MTPDLPATLTPETAKLVLMSGIGFLLLASLLGGIFRTVFLLFIGLRIMRMAALPALAGTGFAIF